MGKLVLRRLAMSVPLMLVVSAVTFVLITFLPGDAARVVAGRNATEVQVEQLRGELGLDRPVWEQYADWLGGALHGDLGTSLVNQQPVAAQLTGRLEPTLALIIGSVVIATLLGLVFGILGARGGVIGRIVDGISVLGIAIPAFWLGLVLVVIFAVRLSWLPPLGYVPFLESPSQWFQHLILPMVTLGVPATAAVAKQTRDAISDALARPFVRTLRAAGVSERAILLRHALKNAAVPVLTVVGLAMIGALSGAIAIETIFAFPGLGGTAVQATASSDLPLIQGVVVYLTAIVIVVNLAVDVAYGYFNPKVKVG
ncbi:ABC transporter permease [Nocardioides sp. NPDC058538]|uniref:ABC transporter permease n=1 Tax=Nocardioides sp. NPDC058538 TaxID=3346542 RepID=UPI003667FD13